MPEFVLQESKGLEDGEGNPFTPSILPEDTICEAILLDVSERIAPWKDADGNDVKRVSFKFALPDYSNQWVWGETPSTFTSHPDCILRGWVQEILGGQELPVGFKLNTDNLRDAKVRVRLGYKKYWSKKHNKEVEQNFVADVLHSRDRVTSSATYVEEPF